jgi:uncharacterized membrane protein
MLFKIYSLHKTAQAWRDDPQSELAGTLQGAIIGYLITAFIIALLILGALGVLAFSSLLGGPYVLAKILFVLGVVPLVTALIVLGRLLSMLRRLITGNKKPRQSGASQNGRVIDVAIEDE